MITENEVIEFMRQASARLALETGVNYAEVRIQHQNDGNIVTWDSYVDGGKWMLGKTLAQSIDAQLNDMRPSTRANRLRMEGQRLLAEAAALMEDNTP